MGDAAESVGALRVARARSGRPVAAVPWALVSVDRTWVWDAGTGLVELDDLASESTRASVDSRSLGPDGLELTYRTSTVGLRAPDDRRVQYDLATGSQKSDPIVHDRSVFRGPNRETLIAVPDDRREFVWWGGVEDRWWGARYTLDIQGESRELEVRHPLGANRSGPAAQFSDDGSRLAITHRFPDRTEQSISVSELSSGHAVTFDGVALFGTGAWTPDGTRLLVTRLYSEYPEVLDTSTGATTDLGATLKNSDVPTDAEIAGWLDDTRLLIGEVRGRRIVIGPIDVETGVRREVIDAPMPSSKMDFGGFLMAPAAVHRSPASIARLPA